MTFLITLGIISLYCLFIIGLCLIMFGCTSYRSEIHEDWNTSANRHSELTRHFKAIIEE